MRRIILGLAAAVGVSFGGGKVSADPGGYAPPGGNTGGINFTSLPQVGGPDTLFGAGAVPPGRGPDRFGLHPCLKRLFHIPVAPTGANGPGSPGGNPLSNPANWAAGGYGAGGPAYNPYGFPPPGAGPMGPGGAGPMGPGGPGMQACGPQGCGPGAYQPYPQYPPMMQGTLVFPYNNLIRSPRDYFMADVNNR